MINHIGFIMDGNRRFAKSNNLSIKEGYERGLNKFLDFINYQIKYKIKETSYFALSTDNFEKRSKNELKIIFSLFKSFILNKNLKSFFIENKIKLRFKGNLNNLNDEFKQILKTINSWNNENKNHDFFVNIALNYDGQEEIVYSLKNIVRQVIKNDLKFHEINEETIKKNIYFNDSKPLEIIVRPGNAPRISGFLLWDSKYSEIYFTKKFWPELTENDFKDILEWYSKIKRNFGK